jgi:P2-related tail formation protein
MLWSTDIEAVSSTRSFTYAPATCRLAKLPSVAVVASVTLWTVVR